MQLGRLPPALIDSDEDSDDVSSSEDNNPRARNALFDGPSGPASSSGEHEAEYYPSGDLPKRWAPRYSARAELLHQQASLPEPDKEASPRDTRPGRQAVCQ
eukprot:TRINITY_DN103400_c0_g1_i1.p2 TRINITY_DN103400_c0_g1~~TRINITY_DN103400_c0_g1_i1.p2  ORF type:complete len:101 (+),score=18.20 TRINITY_DN103400_c0_g1_i1:2-304(+)